METVTRYYRLTKPGIIRANLLTAVAGFLLASQGDIDGVSLIAVMVGVTCIIASGCVCNNYLDRDIDKKMARTKTRALVTGAISARNALIFAFLLGAIGVYALISFTNLLTTVLGVLAFVSYAGVYTYAKRRTVHGTLLGTVPGALSLVAGYTAVQGTLDGTALLLFLVMVVWQMPHFYAISIYRIKEYAAAGLPVLSVVKGVPFTKKVIIAFIAVFVPVVCMLAVLGITGYVYGVVMAAISTYWLINALQKYHRYSSEKWAKGIFGNSLLVLLIFCVMISIDSYLP